MLGDLYTALGTRIHNKGEGPGKETVAAALKDVGLPDSLMEHWDATPYEPQLRASHKEGIDRWAGRSAPR
ncbi:DSBA-like thioredoxin domain-containing protein OS=Streptomyces albaduncus OX=68172 GN=FHS32_000371 PE=4 SV=1 [Streptomyces griseoloalbus]